MFYRKLLICFSLAALLGLPCAVQAQTTPNNPTNKPVDKDDDDGDCKKKGASNSSFSYWIDFGGIPFVEGLPEDGFGIRKIKPTPEIYSPTSLYYNSLATRKVKQSGSSWRVYQPDGEVILFAFRSNSIASPSSESAENRLRLQKLDASMEATTGTPTYLREYFSDESTLLYALVDDFESGEEIWRPTFYTTAAGLEVSFTHTEYRDGGQPSGALLARSIVANIKGTSGALLPTESELEIILEGDATLVSGLESIRQVKSPHGLANVTRSFGVDPIDGPNSGQSISNTSADEATIETISHGLRIGDAIVISNAPDSSYEGLKTVISVTDADNFVVGVSGASLASGACDWYPIEGFRVDIYAFDQIGAQDSATGLYTLSGEPYCYYHFFNPNPGSGLFDEVRVVRNWDDVERVSDFKYEDGTDEWGLTQGSGSASYREVKYAFVDPATDTKTFVRELWDSSNTLVSKREEQRKLFEWGYETVMEIQNPDSAEPLITTYSYYDSSGQNGFGNLQSVTYPNDSWVKYEYDSEGRISKEIEPWKNSSISDAESSHRVTQYSYSPEDPSDVPTAYDTRARKVTVSVGTVVIEKTFYAYYTNAQGGLVEIEKRATENNATYSTASNEVTTTEYYGSGDAPTPIALGRLKSVTDPYGRLDIHDYALNSSNLDELFTVSVTKASTASPSGVDGKSTKTEMIYDYRGLESFNKRYALISGSFQEIGRMQNTYTNQNLVDEVRELLLPSSSYRILSDYDWLGGERESYTDEAGIETTYTYDDLGRLATESKTGVSAYQDYAAQGVITSEYIRTFGEITCGCDGETIVRIYPGTDSASAGALLLESTTRKDAYGRLSLEKDENGYETHYTYDEYDRIRTVKRPDDSTVIYEEYKDGRLKSMTGTGVVDEYYEYKVNFDGSQTTTTHYLSSSNSDRMVVETFDLLGRLKSRETKTFDGSGATTTNTYLPGGLLQSISSPASKPIVYEYDSLGMLEVFGIDYDSSSALEAASTEPMSESITSFEYLAADGGLAAGYWEIVRNKVYDQDNSASSVVVSEQRNRLTGLSGNQVSQMVAVDVYGNKRIATEEIDRTNRVVTSTVDQPDSSIDAKTIWLNGLKVAQNPSTVAAMTEHTYDGLGRLTGTHDPRHVVSSVKKYSTWEYYANSNQVRYTYDADSNRTEYTYFSDNETGAGMVATMVNPLSQTTRYAYDLFGNQTKEWGDAAYPALWVYNSYNQLAQMVTFRNHGTSEIAQWDSASWPTYDNGSEVVDIDSGYTDSSLTEWVYHNASGVLSAKRYYKTSSEFEETEYEYDDAGRITLRTWNRGPTTSYVYNADTGRLTNIDYSEADTADIVRTYTRDGRIKTVTDAAGSRSFEYSAMTLRLDYEEIVNFYGDTVRLDRQYASSGVVGRDSGFDIVTAPTGSNQTVYSIAYDYDGVGRMSEVTNDTASGSPIAFDYSYVTNSNGLDKVESPIHRAQYSYEPTRNLRTEVNNHRISEGPSDPLSKYTYRYDSTGKRTDVVNSGQVFSSPAMSIWGYDSRSQVTSQERYAGSDPDNPGTAVPAEDFDYGFDTIGNRITSVEGGASRNYYADSGQTEAGANMLNQYASVTNPAATISHDTDGNMTQNGDWSYEWNGENRLIEADNYDRSSDTDIPDANGEIWVSYVYDYMGRRIQKQVREYSGGSLTETKTRFLYDGWNMVMTFEWNSGNDTYNPYDSFYWGLDLSNTLQGAGGVGGLLMANLNGNDYYYTYDANGNVGQLLNTTGMLSAEYEYGPFGESVKSSGSAVAFNPYNFSTKYADTQTQLLYYGYRFYDMNIGAWLSKDPLGEEGGWNLYGFVNNDPIGNHDFLGLKKKCCGDKEMKGKRKACCGKKIYTSVRNGGKQCCGDKENGEIYNARFGECCFSPGVVGKRKTLHEARGETLSECMNSLQGDFFGKAGAGLAAGAGMHHATKDVYMNFGNSGGVRKWTQNARYGRGAAGGVAGLALYEGGLALICLTETCVVE
ncbi:RHS repeat-associated core domain-containing protein [Cerasicoccus frondis]|uniref:RHS repeat-associated core domain-containing protein n=1 Tax=Cerasicoccus frondis TaxID=490090 RepID=UPI00285298C7|nr:RHS repeat-associated core domain-containing protein [Cerasicoccus frondis]